MFSTCRKNEALSGAREGRKPSSKHSASAFRWRSVSARPVYSVQYLIDDCFVAWQARRTLHVASIMSGRSPSSCRAEIDPWLLGSGVPVMLRGWLHASESQSQEKSSAPYWLPHRQNSFGPPALKRCSLATRSILKSLALRDWPASFRPRFTCLRALSCTTPRFSIVIQFPLFASRS